jgi:thiol-disulfide isomerase/thioredoxin
MKTTLLFIAVFVFHLLTFGQEKQGSFPEAVKQNIKKYNTISNVSYELGDTEKGQFLFDTLVNNQLVGTKFEDYTLKKVSGGKLKFSAIKKPILIQTYTSWCVLNKGEIPAINKLAKKYNKDLQIVVIFWDKRNNAKNLANQFSSDVQVCYANESYSKDEDVVATLKYSMGFLTSYYLDKELKVVSIKKGKPIQTPRKTPMKEAIKNNFDTIEKSVTDLLLKSDLKSGTLANKF